ncbi:CHASE2 domain-containing protein [Microcoleus sp. FACHB-672]|uniref:CHASE2 domain-containing protein n=1 Tax=Microcoleus sp. FACHB-672 TaxID=2692825 RepID=UPI001688EE94|nr:adenylate/guanylate cyclase domain-containing protein [Microcoleus sp. FACHB-672]MBD2042915.1 adenylate/guanylate cyclase domain-containing protein [Microcoleus sp. FACHB-672]
MWTPFKRLLWQWRGVWITAPSIAALIIVLRVAGFLQPWEWGVFDQFLRLRSPETSDNRVVIVGIDEADVKNIGEANFSDGIYAKLINKLKARQPRAIGLDIYRNIPVEPGHKELVKVFKSTPTLVGIQKVIGDSKSETVAPPEALLENKQAQVGANDLLIDADGKVRRSFFFVPDEKGETVYSLGLLLAGYYLEKQGISPEPVEGTDNWKLGKAVVVPFEANDGGYVRADAGGYQILLNYRGSSRHFNTVSMSDVLEDKLPPDWGRDRVILIGKFGQSFNDSFLTPYSSGLLSLPVPMNGVEIHANLTSQILSAALDNRPLIKSWSEPLEGVWILFWAAAGATLTWHLRYIGGVKSFSVRRTASPIIGAGILMGISYTALLSGWWIPVVPPLLALGGSVIAITAYIARTAGDIRKTFGRYLTDEVVANLLENPEGLKMGGERRKITIFTSDLRGFTALSERLQPEEVVKILNFYLGCMADEITHYQGTIDEFMGDGILVLFGAPTGREDDATRAVACAVAMQLAMTRVNEKMQEWGLPALEMGIGINTGEVVVGNIGSEKRTKYGIVGSQVNLTYRIESYTIGGQILISEPTLKEAGASVKIEGQRQVTPKGVKEPITIYEVAGIGEPYNLFLKKDEEEFFPLMEELPIQYTLLEGKDVSDKLFQGSLVKLSAKGAEVLSQELVPAPLSNIKLNLLKEAGEDIYAKVIEKPADAGRFYIQFTAKPPTVAAKLDALYKSLEALGKGK